ncbi:hypothetical protein [Yersinia pekkanenii]|nr:hypothetical protein [Yersinia pekkanenii]
MYKKYHRQYMENDDFTVGNILDDLNIRHRLCGRDERLSPGSLYLVTAPSINILGKFHQLIIDFRCGIEIFDPNRGVKGRKYYVRTFSARARNQIRLTSWYVDYEILGY